MKRELVYKTVILLLAIIVAIETAWLMAKKRAARLERVPRAAVALKGTIAIVLDDWGYNRDNLYLIKEMRYPLTMSILPNLNYSKAAAEELNNLGFEVILHLPMEPYEKFRWEKNTITSSMDEQKIRGIINKGLAGLPYYKGVSNHMGSKVTEDARVMTIIFKEISEKKLYFLDSLVSPKSVCSPLAERLKVRFARRDIFLDNKEEQGYIRQQIYKLKSRAQGRGYAIGIGHARRVTLEVLKEAIPQLEKEGFKFVYVSQLLR